MRSVIVYGPQGCGKSTHAEAMKLHFCLKQVLDGWSFSEPIPETDTLILTNETGVAERLPSEASAYVYRYEDVMKAIREGL
jgi:hypothetical protein